MSPLARRLAFLVALVLAIGIGSGAWRRGRDLPPPAERSTQAEPTRTPTPQPTTAAPASEPAAAVAPTIANGTSDAFADFRAWSARYLATPPAERDAARSEGAALAARRREALAALIPHDPRQALENAVPMTVRQQLPPEIVAQLEERVSARGFYGVLGVAGGPAGQAPIRREVRLGDGRRFDAFTFGRRAAQATTDNATLTGISVPNPAAPRRPLLALDERPMRVLEPGEIPDPAKRVVETCPVSKKETPVPRSEDGALPPITETTPAVEIEGTIHYICNGGHIQAIEEDLIAAEGATGGAAKPTGSVPSSQSTGVRSLLYLRVAFPETNREPQTEAAAYEMMRQVNDWFAEVSYGNVYLVTTVAPLIVLPYSEAWYKSGGTGGGDEYDVRNDAIAQARRMGYDTAQYDLDVVVYTGGPGSFGGLGYVGSRGSWLKSINVGVACHELGHNFGVWHANFWTTTDGSAIGNGSNTEYGNSYDTMGSASAGDLHFNAQFRTKLNWLPAQSFVTNVTASGTYRIFAFDQSRLDPANRYAFRVRKDNVREYWAEFRQRSLGGNQWTRNGILLNWAPWTSSNSGTQLLDTTPGSPDGKTDAAVVIGATFSDSGAGVHMTPVGKGGTVPESIDVVVNLGTFPGNQAPIVSLAADAGAVEAGASVSFTATASDPDGDALAYAWDFGDRTFGAANSASVAKSWNTAGEYAVRCTVSDMKGRSTSETVIVTVGAPGTFRISGQVTAGGAPLAGVRVSNGQTGSAYRGALTDDDGTYTITGLSAGAVTLSAALGGYTFTPQGFTNPITVGPDFPGANFAASETPVVTIAATDPEASENAGNPGQLTISRTGPTTAALPVRIMTPSGSATRPADYSLSPDFGLASPYLTTTIPAGQSSLVIALLPVDDTAVEGLDVAVFELAAGTGYLIGHAGRAEITIEDSDSTLPVVRLRVVDADATEGGDSAGFVITRTGAATDPLVVKFSVSGSAFAGSDYAALGSQITIPAGLVSVPLSIAPLDDALAEGSESVTVTLLTDPAYIRAAAAAENSGTVNLLDDDVPVLTVAATDASASEAGADTGTFLITRSGSTAQALTVNYAITGSAMQGVDYLPLPGVLTIPAGSTVGSVTITPVDDGIGEPTQNVNLLIRGGIGYVTGNPGNATITIADGGDLPVVAIGVSDGTIAEPADTGKFKVTTAGSGSGNITVRYTVSGTAVSGEDFTPLSGTLSMGRNTTAEITVTPLDDAELEGFESITVALTPDAAYSTHLDTEATLHLADDDQPVVSVSATNTNFTEAIGTGRFYFSRTGATTSALTVNYTLGGTATSGEDFTAPPGAITFAAGSATAQLDLAPINDSSPEGTETVVLTLAPGGYGIGLASAQCYLNDNDALPQQVGFATSSGSGSESAGVVEVSVVLSAAAAGEVTVEYVIGGGSATAGVDYLFTPGVLTFAPGETSKSIPLTVLDDIFNEPGQTVQIRLQNARGAGLGVSTYAYAITDNDPLPSPTLAFAATSASAVESLATPQIVVSLSAPQAAPVSVNVAISGTATEGVDFTGGGGLLTFAAGETAKTLPVTILHDTAYEPGETIVLALENPSGANLGAAAVFTYTIADDDAQFLTITAASAEIDEDAPTGTTFTISRTGSIASALTVSVAISGTATSGSDYEPIPGSVSFAPGEATAPLAVTPINDTLDESPETVVATIGAGDYVINAPASATVTIVDDDINTAPLVSLLSPVGTAAAIPGGVGLVLEASVSDDGKPLVPGAVTTSWSKVSGPGTITFGSATALSTTAQFSAPGSYVLQIAANDGQLQAVRTLAVIVSGGAAWTGTTINNATPAGGFTENGAIVTVTGGGSNISGTSDQFYFVQQALSGDFRFTARVVSFAGGGSAAKAGVMFRTSTAANSAAAFMSLYGPASTGDASSWRYRASAGASYTTTGVAGPRVYPYWVRLTRAGGTMTGEISANGTTWTTVNAVTSALPSAGLIGLAVTSNNTAALATVTFDNVSLTSPSGNVGPLVSAGPPQTIAAPGAATLAGTVSDDGLPTPSVTTLWETVSGPGTVTFANANAPQTTATFSELGTYILRLRADDSLVCTFHDVIVTNALPVVTVTASQPAAEEAHLVAGIFTLTRTGSASDALTVQYSLSGTATEGVDYEAQVRLAPHGGISAPQASATFGIGQTSIELFITPLADAVAEGAETVKLSLTHESSYTVGVPASGTVSIADLPLDGWRNAIFGANANNPALSGDDADPDGDGRVNWFEFALGSNPLSALFEPLPLVALEGSDVTLTYRRPAYAPDFAYAIEETLDLAVAWGPATFTEETLSNDGTTQLIKARVPAGAGPQKMLRLRVTRP